MKIKAIQIHKRESIDYSKIQDKYCISDDNSVFALADGTTQSFRSADWATLLTTSFVHRPSFEANNLINQFEAEVSKFKSIKIDYDPNPAIASLQRDKSKKGATSTFIGMRLLGDSTAELICCGDSNFFLVREGSIIQSYPYSSLDDLDQNRSFINTELLLKKELHESEFSSTSLNYQVGDSIIIATDALSRLFLKSPDSIRAFAGISTFGELEKLTVKLWNSNRLEEDDISAIVIGVGSENQLKVIKPPNDFSFPVSQSEEFKPRKLVEKSHGDNSNIKRQISSDMDLKNKLVEIERRLKQQSVLLIILIFISSLGLIGIFQNFLNDELLNDSDADLHDKTKTRKEALVIPRAADISNQDIKTTPASNAVAIDTLTDSL